ncbi:MAG TPA: YcxB family protein [Candidatus Nitrosocosmicus sp.]|nr:YcxB family protein [Candidatus Nitrosocosmicus sp.]
MADTNEKSFDIKVTLKLLDYYRYYFSLFNLKRSGKIITAISVIVISIYSLSLISLVYIAFTAGALTWTTGKGILLDLVIIALFTTPFSRAYLAAYNDAKANRLVNREISITITEDKFIAYPDGKRVEYPWKKMYKTFDFRHSFALFIDKKELAFVIPKRYFKNKDQIKFVNDVIAKIKK